MSDALAGSNHDSISSASGTLELVRRAAHDGAADVREAATQTWATTSLFVSRFVYTTCYTISYGVVFPATLLAQAVPKNNAAVRGLIEGAHAAVDKVDELRGTALDSPLPATLAPA